MSNLARTCFASFCLIALSPLVQAQTPSAKDAPTAKSSSTKKTNGTRAAADPLAEQRRMTAISLLSALADEAKGYHDQVLSARVLGRAADALWESDTERARTLFHRAWDAAESADAESARRMEEDIRKQEQSNGSAAVTSPPNLRNEVLRLAARHDRTLGEEFLKKLEEAKERETANSSLRRDPWQASLSQSQRLRLATQLLQDGDVDRALEYADPALDSVTIDSINFLSALREKKAEAADQRFAAMLARAAADPASDANTISGLSSYAFTPFYFVAFLPGGGANQMQRRESTPAPDLPADLRKAFFRTAAQILLRPLPPQAQDTTSAGRTGKYMVIKRLLPLFDQYAPERVAELRVQMAALSPDVAERDRTSENRAITKGIVPDDNARDSMQGMQERLDHAADSAERDAIYADMAASLAGSGDARARDLIDKIEDTELRQQTRAYTDFEFLDNALERKDVQELIRIARSGELTHIQRVWGFTQAARLLTKSDRARRRDTGRGNRRSSSHRRQRT
jgi:hypothetical protein